MTQVLNNPDIWNVLHDGDVVRISGDVPGDVQLAVAIDYLRRLFSDPGECIILTLHECTSFFYEPLESQSPIADLAAIANLKPWIVSAEEPSTIFCSEGTLRIQAESFTLALDSGRCIVLEELFSAAEAYWTEWSKKVPKGG